MRSEPLPTIVESFGMRGSVVFSVNDTLFNIAHGQLVKSAYFNDMLRDDNLGDTTEGTTAKPIKLAAITAGQMDSFVKVLNHCAYDAPLDLSFEQWTAALSLATMWNFDTVRHFVIGQVEPHVGDLDLCDVIDIGFKCDAKEWAVAAYVKLCDRDEPLSVGEGHRLGIERFAALCELRERGRKHNTSRTASSLPDSSAAVQGTGEWGSALGWGATGTAGWGARGRPTPPPTTQSLYKQWILETAELWK